MKKIDRLVRLLEEAKRKDSIRQPVRLATKYRHYINTTSKHEQAVREIEKINRRQPVTITKIKPVTRKD